MNIRDISKLANVSPATVSMVLNDKKGVSEATRERVLQIIKENGYNPAKRYTHTGDKVLFLKHRKHGMLVEENQGFISTIMDAIEAECRLRGYELNIVVSDNSFRRIIETTDFSLFSGMILLATELDQELYPLLEQVPIPFVAVDNRVPTYPCSSVSIDNWGNVYQAVHCCREHGHDAIAYFRSNIDIQNFKERREAFLESVNLLGMSHVQEDEYLLTPTMLGSYEDMKAILQQGVCLPTCAFADNDSIAIGAIKALKEYGYRIPDDFSVIGFDDIAYSAVISPALTTIQVSKGLIGCLAVKQLCRLLEPNRSNIKIQIPGRLVIRNSVRVLPM